MSSIWNLFIAGNHIAESGNNVSALIKNLELESAAGSVKRQQGLSCCPSIIVDSLTKLGYFVGYASCSMRKKR